MITIAGNSKSIVDESKLSELERSIYQKKKSSSFNYTYSTVDVLLFELAVRSHIVEASKLLNKINVKFSDFQHSKCNKAFWDRNENGGFQLKKDVTPP